MGMNHQPLQISNQRAYEPSGWLTDRLAGWIAGSLAASLADWLAGWLADSSENEQDKYRNEMAMNDQPLQKND